MTDKGKTLVITLALDPETEMVSLASNLSGPDEAKRMLKAMSLIQSKILDDITTEPDKKEAKESK